MHKHAEVFRAIADGVPLSEFEAMPTNSSIDWNSLYHRVGDIARFPDKWIVRRKPQYIMVNGFKVPKPLDVPPADRFYVPEPCHASLFYCDSWDGNHDDILILGRGLVHESEKSAIAHAKAMLGIDPEWSE